MIPSATLILKLSSVTAPPKLSCRKHKSMSTPTDSTQVEPQEFNRALMFSLIAMMALFFLWGFMSVFMDMLIPRLKSLFNLDYTSAMLVQFSFFLAYLFISLPAGKLTSRYGYRSGLITGLAIMTIAVFLFIPAARLQHYPLFLCAIFILASGITFLQVSANPLVLGLGNPSTGASRLTLVQAFNSLGTTIGPIIASLVILDISVLDSHEIALLNQTDKALYYSTSAQSLEMPFLVSGIALAGLLLAFYILRSRNILLETNPPETQRDSGTLELFLHNRKLQYGMLAIFLYVGAEVSIGSFLINYFMQGSILDISASEAARYVSFYWGGAMLGRFVGAAILRKFNANTVLMAAALMAMCLTIGTTLTGGVLAAYLILAVGLFNSIHFPTIFSLAIQPLKDRAPQGSSLLCLSIVGGAIVPLIMGQVADTAGIQTAFIIPALCYTYIAWYGLKGA